MTIEYNESTGKPITEATSTDPQMTKDEYEKVYGIFPDDIKRYMPGTSHPYRLNQHISFYGFGDEIERRTGLKCFCSDIDMVVYLVKPDAEDLAGLVLVDAAYVDDLEAGWIWPEKKKGITVLKKHAKALNIPSLVVIGEHNVGTEEKRLTGRLMRPVLWHEMQVHWAFETKYSSWSKTHPARPLVDVVEGFANELKANVISGS